MIYEPSHLSGVHATRQLVRGMILFFLVYTPSNTEEEIMTEFRKQTVVFAYVYTSVLRNNYLVVRVRLRARLVFAASSALMVHRPARIFEQPPQTGYLSWESAGKKRVVEYRKRPCSS